VIQNSDRCFHANPQPRATSFSEAQACVNASYTPTLYTVYAAPHSQYPFCSKCIENRVETVRGFTSWATNELDAYVCAVNKVGGEHCQVTAGPCP
jgi:hypothetical protein